MLISHVIPSFSGCGAGVRRAVAMVRRARGSNGNNTPEAVADCVSATPEATDGGNLPAAVAAPTHSGVVVAHTREIYGMECTQPWKLNNTALKWFRDNNEHPPGVPTRWVVDLTDTDPCDIGVLQRTKGAGYSFKVGERQPWSWRQMLAVLMKQTRC